MSSSQIPQTLTEINREHFNIQAATYDSGIRVTIAEKCVKAILEEFGHSSSTDNDDDDKQETAASEEQEHSDGVGFLDEDKTQVLDFACGTGLISQFLLPYVHSILGVDTSQGMVNVYNQKSWRQGLIKDEMQAICVDLLNEEGEDPLNGRRFDLIVCSSSYHHLEDIKSATKTLATYLKPGTAFESSGGLLENVTVRTAFSFKKLIKSEGVEREFEYLLAKGRRSELVE
ncbi:3579_t:CDS:2 [Ambispora gerdemannii]|uniref:3579_t:CDS:1 n=1 Tax=Ambispora gerdemannii TaxID=144530 RepID=A0A9N9AR37_9GLOM|nr:3579_t:CDS:2 [Ambispora gerdemannii]